MILKMSIREKEKSVLEAFTGLKETSNMIRIFTRDGNLSLINSHLIRFTSPLIKNIFKDVPCCSSYMIFIPDVSKNAVDSVLSIISNGFSDFNSITIKDIKEVQEAAEVLQIDLYNLDYVEKSVVDPCPTVDDIPVGVAITKEAPNFTASDETVNQVPYFKSKSEYSYSSEYVEQNDSLADTIVKEEPNDQFSTNVVELVKVHPNIKCERTPLDGKMSANFLDSQIFSLLSDQSLSLPLNPPPAPHLTSLNKELELQFPVKSEPIVSPPVSDLEIYKSVQNPFDHRKPAKTGMLTDVNITGKENAELVKEEKSSVAENGTFADMPVSGPPESTMPELQYLYRISFHRKCGTKHRRVDLCPAASDHVSCGKMHSPAMECSGSWMTLDQFDMTAIRWPETEGRILLAKTKGNDSESEPISTVTSETIRWPETESRLLLTKTMGSNSQSEPIGTRSESVQTSATGLRKRKRVDGIENISLSDMAINEMEAVKKVLNIAIPVKDDTRELKEDIPLQFDQQVPAEEKKLNVLNRKETNTIHKGEVKGSEHTRLPKRVNWTGELESIPVNMEAHQKEAAPKSSKPELQYIYEMNYHAKCGLNHRRVDLCPVSSVHAKCGKRHNFVENCNGTWKTLNALEMIAAGFPETKLKLQPRAYINHQETKQVRASSNTKPNMEIEGKGLELFTRKSIRYKKNSSKEMNVRRRERVFSASRGQRRDTDVRR